mmetsp:Transcript_11173/g.24001  ORF Transcript_11173/g.24001 Transcript_11173/m.24001 type:complete len:320 (+) Transcript_11173:653-1612(+)
MPVQRRHTLELLKRRATHHHHHNLLRNTPLHRASAHTRSTANRTQKRLIMQRPTPTRSCCCSAAAARHERERVGGELCAQQSVERSREERLVLRVDVVDASDPAAHGVGGLCQEAAVHKHVTRAPRGANLAPRSREQLHVLVRHSALHKRLANTRHAARRRRLVSQRKQKREAEFVPRAHVGVGELRQESLAVVILRLAACNVLLELRHLQQPIALHHATQFRRDQHVLACNPRLTLHLRHLIHDALHVIDALYLCARRLGCLREPVHHVLQVHAQVAKIAVHVSRKELIRRGVHHELLQLLLHVWRVPQRQPVVVHPH